jgi:tetratricopeptide (TPR) repeat protein
MGCRLQRTSVWAAVSIAIVWAFEFAPRAIALEPTAALEGQDDMSDDAAPMLPIGEDESVLSFAEEEPGQLPEDPTAAELNVTEPANEADGENALDGPAMEDRDGNDSASDESASDESAKPEDLVEAPPIDPATLAGVTPGETTHEALRARWGKPLRVQKVPGGVRESYRLGGFERVRATIIEDVVESVAVQLAHAVSAKKLARQLEIGDVEPVDVFDDTGRPMGRAFPERGILFGFVGDEGVPQVLQIIVQPIDAEPFLARAQRRMPTRYADCLADLKQALRLAPANAKAHALHAELTFQAGELSESMKSARKAIEFAPAEPQYKLLLAQAQAEIGDYPTAIERLREISENEKHGALARARAYVQWGDCVAAGPQRDFAEAMKLHAKGVKLVEPLTSGGKYSQRRAAKETLIEAHLAIARDIGSGRWQQKSEVIPKWLERALTMADDVIAYEHGEPRLRLHVYEQALAALAVVPNPPDAGTWIRGATQLGATMLEEAADPGYKATLSWQLAVALGNAVEIESARKHRAEANELAKLANECFESGAAAGQELPERDFVRGRLMYRLGEMAATTGADHRQAVQWFDRAVPLLERAPASAAAVRGRRGEMLVSMAISYWETNHREQALRLTERGTRLMEQAAGDGLVPKASLATPYANLANMHKKLGHGGDAKKYSVMAASFQEKVDSK